MLDSSPALMVPRVGGPGHIALITSRHSCLRIAVMIMMMMMVMMRSSLVLVRVTHSHHSTSVRPT